MSNQISEEFKEMIGEIILPEDMVDGILVKVKTDANGEEKIFGVFEGMIAYVTEDQSEDKEVMITKEMLFDENHAMHSAIWNEIKEYNFYKFIIHGSIK